MVCLFCMSERVGLVRVAQRQTGLYLPGTDGPFQRDCSEVTAQEIDAEVKRILDRAYVEAKEILQQHRDQLELVTNELLKAETLDATSFNRLIGRSDREDAERPGRPVELTPPV
jgi:cell division protease FtsH